MELWHGGVKLELTPIEEQMVVEARQRGRATIMLRGMIVWLGNLSDHEVKPTQLKFRKRFDPEKFGEEIK
jgi:hypothetical protein